MFFFYKVPQFACIGVLVVSKHGRVSGIWLPKSLQEDSLFAQSNNKSTEYKEKWAVEVFRNWQVVREQKLGSSSV